MGNVGDKDERLKLHTSWFTEWAELESAFRRRDIAGIKAFLTCARDNIRPPYARTVHGMERASIIVATTNQDEFLGDTTGNRRFWVVPVVGKIDIAQLEEERDRIWAAAVGAFLANEPWWLTDEEAELSAIDTANYALTDPWEESLERYAQIHGTVVVNEFLVGQLKKDLKDIGRGEQMRVADILKAWKWKKRKEIRADGSRPWTWARHDEVGQTPQSLTQQDSSPPAPSAQPLSPGQPPQMLGQEVGQPEMPDIQSFSHPLANLSIQDDLSPNFCRETRTWPADAHIDVDAPDDDWG
jgi:predicted P-loop ATPase